jgi:hypothetical protein
MLEAVTLGVLRAAAEDGFMHSVRAQLARVDPLLRPWARRRVERRIARALTEVGSGEAIDGRSREAVADAFVARKRVAGRARNHRWLTPLVLIALLGGGALAAQRLFATRADVALRDSPAGTALGVGLHELSTELSRLRSAGIIEPALLRDKLADEIAAVVGPAREHLGADCAAELDALLTTLVEVNGLSPEEGRPRLAAALARTNAALAAAGAPAVLVARREERPRGSFVGLVAFAVRGRSTSHAQGAAFDLVYGAALKRDPEAAATLESDAGGMLVADLAVIEAQLLKAPLLPALAAASPWELAGEAAVSPALGELAGAVARSELLPLAQLAEADATELVRLVRERREALDAAGHADHQIGLRLSAFDHAFFERELRGDIHVKRVFALDREIARFEAAFERLTLALARDELELSLRRATAPRVAVAGAASALDVVDDDLLSGDDILWAQRELRAQLGLLAASPMPRARLVLLTEPIWGARERRHSIVARACFAAVAEALDAAGPARWYSGGELHHDALAQAYADVLHHGPGELRAAAAEGYRALFGGEPPPIAVELPD